MSPVSLLSPVPLLLPPLFLESVFGGHRLTHTHVVSEPKEAWSHGPSNQDTFERASATETSVASNHFLARGGGMRIPLPAQPGPEGSYKGALFPVRCVASRQSIPLSSLGS